MIESYSFGRMVIDGKSYTSDLVIYPDGRIQDSWWRKSGHSLSDDDIRELMDSGPDVIVAGTGASGIMTPDAGLGKMLAEKGIEFRAVPTGEAVKLYNEIHQSRRTGACFHLTC